MQQLKQTITFSRVHIHSNNGLVSLQDDICTTRYRSVQSCVDKTCMVYYVQVQDVAACFLAWHAAGRVASTVALAISVLAMKLGRNIHCQSFNFVGFPTPVDSWR